MKPGHASSHRGAQQGELRGGSGGGGVSKTLNQQITQASKLQDLVQLVVVNFGRMNAVNFCTAYHRIAKQVEEARRVRSPPEGWPPAQQQQLGGLLSEMNQTLMHRLEEVQAHNLGLTMWSISKTYQLPQKGAMDLLAELQAEVTRRLASVDKDQYMRDKFYNMGGQALSNIVHSGATMGLRPNYDMLHAVARGVAWQVDEFKPQGLANIMWALGKMGAKVTPEVRQMVDVLGREMVAQITHSRHKGTVAPQNISNMLHGLANLGISPSPDLLCALARSADSQLRQFGPQELTNTVWSLSQMHRAGAAFTPEVDALLDRIPDELLLLFSDRAWRARVKPQTISNLALAYAHLHRAPQMLMMELLKEAQPMLGQFKPQELSNFLWAMATMGFYPGTGTVDAVTRAAATACGRMKPQELANTVWAWATMRHFPGVAAMEHLLGCAEAQLDRFKSQELGMLGWAAAKLGYMPAATLVRAALPHLAAARQPAVQDLGNFLWAFTVFDILTPEVMQQLAERLLSLPRESYTHESFIQLYQAKMSLSQQWYDIAQYIPPELLSQAETEWRRQSGDYKVSSTHRDVASVMRELNIEFDMEKKIEDGLMSVDIALRGEMVAVEVDGSAHFTINEPYVPLGRTIWRWRLLASRGWRVVTVPYFRWAKLQSVAQKKQYLYMLLQCRSVWECYSLDPQSRDAPFHLPANLAHLTPDEVFQLAAVGVAPSTLVAEGAARRGATPATSPATPLLAGLGPAAGGSGGSLASAGLPPSLLPTPIALGARPSSSSGLEQAAVSQVGAAGGAYGRLPDNLYATESIAQPTGGYFSTMRPMYSNEGQVAPPAGRHVSSNSSMPAGNRRGSSGTGSLNASATSFSFGGPRGSGIGAPATSAGTNYPTSNSRGGGGSIGGASGEAAAAAAAAHGSGSGTGSPVATSQLRPAAAFGSNLSLAPGAPAFRPLSPATQPGSPAYIGGSGLGSGSSLASSSAAASDPNSAAVSPALPPFSGLRGTPNTTPMGPPGLGPPPGLSPGAGAGAPPGLMPAPQLAPPQLMGLSVAAALRPRPPATRPSSGTSSGGRRRGSLCGSDTGAAPPSSASALQHVAGLSDESDDDTCDLRSLFGSVIGVQQPKEAQGPLSVEDVRRKLALLPADEAVADVAPAWLADWDAAGVVDLLCQLDTPTTAARALQLFEWLRSLGPDSPLAHLCTPATYSAMIGLFGRWRKPKQAVRLFAELKERGEDSQEVHSALVEAFCRSGQPEVALDACANMQALGLAPSPAAARAVLEVHMQRGAWEAADAVLASLVAAGAAGGSGGRSGEAGAELFNTLIERACAAGSPAAAQSAFNHMCQAGVAPTVGTFVALLGALRSQHAAREVAELAVGLAEQAQQAAASLESAPSGAALLGVHEACRVQGWWELSLALLEAVEEAGGSPSLAEVNSAVAACAAEGAIAEALHAFACLARHGLQPCADTYLALVQAHCSAGQWAAGTAEYDAMLAVGLVPGEELVSLVVDALWCSGLAWAQASALSTFNAAVSKGWLPPARAFISDRLLKVDLRARHLGTGLLRMHRWLHDMRAVIGNSSAPTLLDECKRVCIMSTQGAEAGDGGSSPSALLSSELKGALGASLVLHKAPFRVTYADGRAMRMESSTFMVKKWLFSESFTEWDQAFIGHASATLAADGAGEAHAVLALPPAAQQLEAKLQEDGTQALARIRAFEAAHPPQPAAFGLQPGAGYTGQRRRELAEAVQHLASCQEVAPQEATPGQLWLAALVLLDRSAAAGHCTRMDAALAAACVTLAAEQEGISLDPATLAAQLNREMTVHATGAEPEDAVAAEVEQLRTVLQGDTACLSALHCWKAFVDRLQCSVGDQAQLGDSLHRLHQLALEDEHFCLAYPPSIQAAAALTVARQERGVVPYWPTVLQQLTGFQEGVHPEFSAALRALQKDATYGSTVTQAVFS